MTSNDVNYWAALCIFFEKITISFSAGFEQSLHEHSFKLRKFIYETPINK
jgi:hypothetical protein